MVGQAITNPISGPSFDFTLAIGPELDNSCTQPYTTPYAIHYVHYVVEGYETLDFPILHLTFRNLGVGPNFGPIC